MSRGTSTVAVDRLAIVVALASLRWRRRWCCREPDRDRQRRGCGRRPSSSPSAWDDLGRSVLSRVIHGYRVSLASRFASVLMAVLLGLRSAPGRLRRRRARPGHHAARRYPDGLPRRSSWPSPSPACSAPACSSSRWRFAIVYVPIVARVVRAAVLATKPRCNVEGARAVGATARRLVLRHIVPNCVTPLLVQASVLMAIAILVEAALSFLASG